MSRVAREGLFFLERKNQRTFARWWVVRVAIAAGVGACAPGVPQDLRPALAPDAALRVMSEGEYSGGWSVANPSFSSATGPVLPAAFGGGPRADFSTDDGIVVIADVVWDEPTTYGGVHSADWRLFRGSALLKEKRTDERLSGKPARILSHISAGSFPPGSYRVELLLDEKPFGAATFNILPARVPAPVSTAITGPDCAGEPPGTIIQLNRIRPNYPLGAVDRRQSGCAALSIILDNDGHVSGVRVDGEFPQAAGFGDAAAQAAHGAIFAPGNGGKTTHLVIHFKSAN